MKEEMILDPEKNTLISDEYLSQVRSFGALGYSPERIANILGLSKKSLPCYCAYPFPEIHISRLIPMENPLANIILMPN